VLIVLNGLSEKILNSFSGLYEIELIYIVPFGSHALMTSLSISEVFDPMGYIKFLGLN
jgi:hypothetical protein